MTEIAAQKLFQRWLSSEMNRVCWQKRERDRACNNKWESTLAWLFRDG